MTQYILQCLQAPHPFIHVMLLGVGGIGLTVGMLNATGKNQRWIDIGLIAVCTVMILLAACVHQ